MVADDGVRAVGWALAGLPAGCVGRGGMAAWGLRAARRASGRGLSSAGDECEAAVAVEFEEIVDGGLEPPLRAAGWFAA